MYEGEILKHAIFFYYFICEWKTSNQESKKLQLLELLSQFTIKLNFFPLRKKPFEFGRKCSAPYQPTHTSL